MGEGAGSKSNEILFCKKNFKVYIQKEFSDAYNYIWSAIKCCECSDFFLWEDGKYRTIGDRKISRALDYLRAGGEPMLRKKKAEKPTTMKEFCASWNLNQEGVSILLDLLESVD